MSRDASEKRKGALTGLGATDGGGGDRVHGAEVQDFFRRRICSFPRRR